MPPQFLENIGILCFESRFRNNSVIRLKSNILSPPNSWAGYATESESLKASTQSSSPLVIALIYIKNQKYFVMFSCNGALDFATCLVNA